MINLSVTSWIALAVWTVVLVGVVIWAQSFRKRQRNLMANLHYYAIISGLMLCLAIGSLATRGLNYGLDFTGGTLLELGSYKMVSAPEVQKLLADFKEPPLGDKMVQVGAEMATDTEGKQYQRIVIRVTRETPTPDGGRELRDQEPVKLQQHLTAALGELKLLQSASIGPTMTGELKRHALLAVVVAMIVQAVYIFARFGFQWRFGAAADVAIIHDVVIMVGLYSLSGRQIDSPFMAAVLTVAGYSVMDSVVIFDRIRENMQQYRNKPFKEVVNESVNQTMTRSVNTTLTVVITLLAIYFFGGSTLQNFAYALLVGVISGAYSSIFVAAPILIVIDKYWGTPKEKEAVSVAERLREAGELEASEESDSEAETGTDARRGARSRRSRGPRRRSAP